MEFQATFFIEVSLGRGGGVNLKFTRKLPFFPHVGMWIVAVDGDEYRKVEDVFWSEADGFHIFLQFEETTAAKGMKRLGWVSAD